VLGGCDVACDFDPRSDWKEIAGQTAPGGGAIGTLQELIRIVHRPQEVDIVGARAIFGGVAATSMRGREKLALPKPGGLAGVIEADFARRH
jgi:hypothetical protein